MTLDEAVELVDYDPRWPERFRSDAAEVMNALGGRVGGIEHIGSTAVPGMSAKPVVDVLVGLVGWPMSSGDREALQALGYEYLGEAGVAGREYFRRRAPHATNLAVVDRKSRLWSDNMILRDYLRAQPDVAAEYSRAKLAAWSGGARTLIAYSAAKGEEMASLLKRAREWSTASRIEHIAQRAGPRLAVRVTGDRPSVLLLHGACGSSAVWAPVLTALADLGFQAVALDYRGHGQSDGREELHRWSIEDYVADVRAVLGHWETLRVLVGHSMGGLVAQLSAATTSLDRIVLVASSPTEGMLRNGIRMAIAHPWTLAVARVQRSFLRLYRSRRVARSLLFHPDTREDVVDSVLARFQEESWVAGNQLVTLLPDPRQVTCPATVIAGERDRIVYRSSSERTARDYGVPLRILARCGHMVPCEADPAELARAIAEPGRSGRS